MSNIVNNNPNLPVDDKILSLKQRLTEIWRDFAAKHNAGYFWETSGTSAPSSGTWSQGDKCKNTTPSELGSAGSKYVIVGWCCVASGSPGTWVQMRSLTGN